MNENGRLFVFEGVDAAGKSSLAKEFAAKIQGHGGRVQQLSFPGRTAKTLGELVYRLHHDPQTFGIEHLSAASLQALHIAAHLDAIESTIVPLLARGVQVV